MPEILAYRLLLRLLFPVVAASTGAIAVRDGSARYLLQRLGYFRESGDTTRPLWIHCASVGETNAAMALIEAWLERYPGDAFVLTTNTVTAARTFARRAEKKPAGVRHCYLPLDYPRFCRRFLDAVRPRCALVMETEIWLNLFRECRGRNIPLFIVNARLSRRTLDGARWFRGYYRQSLAMVTAVFARGGQDAEAFAGLGTDPGKIVVVGNLKRAGRQRAEKETPRLIDGPYVLAASTHEDEEARVAGAWRRALKLAGSARGPLLVIAPRHPARARAIARQLKKHGFHAQRRSREAKPRDTTSVYIADTLGELPALIRHAELVFTGGSLVPVGGHNVLEPAQLGTPQAVGPHTQNVHEDVTALKAAGGLIEVADESALTEVFRAAIEHAPEHGEAAKKALALARELEGVADAYADRLEAAGVAHEPASPTGDSRSGEQPQKLRDEGASSR